MKFGYLILRKIITFVANICQILRLKYTEFNFGLGSTGELIVLPQTLQLDLRGFTSKGGKRKG